MCRLFEIDSLVQTNGNLMKGVHIEPSKKFYRMVSAFYGIVKPTETTPILLSYKEHWTRWTKGNHATVISLSYHCTNTAYR